MEAWKRAGWEQSVRLSSENQEMLVHWLNVSVSSLMLQLNNTGTTIQGISGIHVGLLICGWTMEPKSLTLTLMK